jgi:two-component system, NarL family, sensor histidine kinase UhpB
MLPAEYEIFAVIAAGILVLMVLLSVLIFSINISRKRRLKLEKEIIETHYRAREETLLQVSRDLHDDIGASLSSIQLFNELLQRQLNNENYHSASQMSDKIALYIKEISENVSDMAWLFRQGDHTVEVLTKKVQIYAADIAGTKSISFNINVTDNALEQALSLLQQKNCYLICKEAINNAVKYSGCTNIDMVVGTNENWLTLQIVDNGKGLIKNSTPNGNGLRNMNQRALEMSGIFNLSNVSESGLQVKLQVPITGK